MEGKEYFGKQVTFRLKDEMREKLIESYESIAGTSEQVKMGDFFHNVCELSIDALIYKEEMKGLHSQLNKITLDLENARFALKSKDDEIAELKESSTNQSVVEELKEKISVLEQSLAEQTIVIESADLLINEYQSSDKVLVRLTPAEKALMDEITKRETNRVKKEVTPSMILRDLFNTYMIKGPCDVFPLIPDGDLRKILSQFKK